MELKNYTSLMADKHMTSNKNVSAEIEEDFM